VNKLIAKLTGLNASQVRLLLRLVAQAAAAATAFAVSHPAYAGAVGALTVIEAILQKVVKEVAALDEAPADDQAA